MQVLEIFLEVGAIPVTAFLRQLSLERARFHSMAVTHQNHNYQKETVVTAEKNLSTSDIVIRPLKYSGIINTNSRW